MASADTYEPELLINSVLWSRQSPSRKPHTPSTELTVYLSANNAPTAASSAGGDDFDDEWTDDDDDVVVS